MKNVSMEMKKVELMEIAIGLGVDVKKSWNKTKLIEVITNTQKELEKAQKENKKDNVVKDNSCKEEENNMLDNIKTNLGEGINTYIFNANEGEFYKVIGIDGEDLKVVEIYCDNSTGKEFTLNIDEILINNDFLSFISEEERNEFIGDNVKERDDNMINDEEISTSNDGLTQLLDEAQRAMAIKNDIKDKGTVKEEVKEDNVKYKGQLSYLINKTNINPVFITNRDKKHVKELYKVVKATDNGIVYMYAFNNQKQLLQANIDVIVTRYTVVDNKTATVIYKGLTKVAKEVAATKNKTEEVKPKYNFNTKDSKKLFENIQLCINEFKRDNGRTPEIFLIKGKRIMQVVNSNIKKNGYRGLYAFDITDSGRKLYLVDMSTVVNEFKVMNTSQMLAYKKTLE